MKVSLNWLNEFVDLKGIDIKDIVSRFSLTTAEIEGYEQKGSGFKNIVVGEIKTCENHPNSAKLHVLTVDNGTEIVPVVCGAPNARAGLKVAFAKVGAKLGDIEIGKAMLAGKESHGMCCSARELGISNNHDGIIELDAAAKVGAPIETAIPEMADTIIEIDNKSLTNRPDLWGHYGIAREMSVIFDKPLKPLASASLEKYAQLPEIPVKIENKKDCLSYGAIRVDNITRASSPLFMQVRLFYCGINAHNFLVDLTNYIMLETAQPNHAFDAGKVGKISIGNVAAGTDFVTLKDQAIKATESMLFIKSNGNPVALAGVMGGKNSEIEDNTQNCVFEFATFDATCVRKTAAAIGVRTDASNRYEKSLDTHLNITAAARTIQFIETYDRGAKVVSCFNHVIGAETKPIKLAVRKDYLERFCGVEFDYGKVKKNLTALGFGPIITKDEISVTVPSYRATKDVSCEADLIEEIIRTHGYDNIKPVAPRIELAPVDRLAQSKLTARLKNLLCDKYAFDEVHTYVWNDTKTNKQLNIEVPSYLRVVNSCIKDNDAIRSHMGPSLIGVAAKNKQLNDVRIFEIGRVCVGLNEKDNTAIERQNLGICISSKSQSGEILYKKLSEMLRDVFEIMGYRLQYHLGTQGINYLHPKNSAIISVQGKEVGSIGIVHPTTASAIDSKINLACAGISLTLLDGLNTTENHAARISKFQKNTLDFTFTTDKIYGDIEAIFNKFSHPLNMGYHLKDIFTENNGKISYTLTFTVGSYEKTLTAAEIDTMWQAVVNHARNAGLMLKE